MTCGTGNVTKTATTSPIFFSRRRFRSAPRSFPRDGRFIVYTSDESGRDEIYVQPFPEGGRRTTVSSNGGQNPRWSRDGRELSTPRGAPWWR